LRRFTFDGTQKKFSRQARLPLPMDAAGVALASNYRALELNAMKVTVEKAP
jgi:hypothetical protein